MAAHHRLIAWLVAMALLAIAIVPSTALPVAHVKQVVAVTILMAAIFVALLPTLERLGHLRDPFASHPASTAQRLALICSRLC